MDNLPKINWIWSPDTEVERIVHATKVAASGFYGRHGFVIVPEVIQNLPEICVVIPDLKYNVIGDYWHRLEATPLQLPIKIPSDVSSMLVLILDGIGIQAVDCHWLAREWKQVEQIWWEELNRLLPEEVSTIGEIEVRMTNFGTVSSYSFLTKRKHQKLIVYLRKDVGIEHLAEAIFSAILYPYRNESGFSWSRREAIVDFYLTRQTMKQLFPNYRPTLTNLPRVSQGEREKSIDYEKKLGWPVKSDNLERIIKELPVSEGKALKLLNVNKGEMVSFDNIADLLWGEGEFKTFWAINKLVQRLRKHLDKLGMEGKMIKTLRGRGYILQ